MTELKNETKREPMAQVQHYLHVVFKWKWISLIFFSLVVTSVTVYSFLKTSIYTASGSVWIENESNILPFEGLQSFSSGINLQSHVRLLKRQTLASEVIEKLKLYENPDFIGRAIEENESTNISAPIFRNRIIERFLKSLSISPVGGTSFLDVKFSDPNPILAAEVLNTLFDAYIDMLVRKRYRTSEQATEFLNLQIAKLRSEINESVKELSNYGSEKNILPLTAAETSTVSQLEGYNIALREATLDTINKLNYYNQVNSAPLGGISDSSTGSIIQSLRTQYSTLSREYSTRLVTLRPEYPEMLRLKSEMDEAKQALQDETQNLINVAYSEYLTALERENSIKKLLEELKIKVYKTNSQSVIYNSLQLEIENKNNLLENLSNRKSETDVSSQLIGLDAINVWIVDQATPPVNPISPNKRKNVLIGFLIGMLGGVCLAIGIEYLDRTIKTSEEIAFSLQLPILGVIPSFEAETKSKGPRSEFNRLINIIRGGSSIKGMKNKSVLQKPDLRYQAANNPNPEIANKKNKIELIASRMPHSIQSESYRSIRTSMLISFPQRKIKSILMTSPLASEGKSSTVSNLGITIAETNKRVVIVDSDLRKPIQGQIFGLKNGPPLNQFLSSQIDMKDIVHPTHIQNLFLIKAEPISANPIGLLTSERMNNLIAYLRETFDYVLIDSPPILAVSDALALSPMVDGVILIARGGQTPIKALKQANQKLDSHHFNILGLILNGVNLIEQDGYYARQYYHYSKSG
ncbi:MAG: polysaccharide biosynthesis tyrosine autokinase [Desulfobacterales bacterium]|nr:polysaccharide biosynthesis tyrosine autokinase [Desulfobacterales bacterium]